MQPTGETNKRITHCKGCNKSMLKGEGLGMSDGFMGNRTFAYYFCKACFDKEIALAQAWASADKNINLINKHLQESRVDYIDVEIRMYNLLQFAGVMVAEVAERINRKLTNSLVVNYAIVDQIIRDEYAHIKSIRQNTTKGL